MPEPYHQRIFRKSKAKALQGLLDSLEREKLPASRGYYLTTGNITSYFADRYRPLQRGCLLAVLREAGVPHDSNNKFLPLRIYNHQPDLEALSRKYTESAQ